MRTAPRPSVALMLVAALSVTATTLSGVGCDAMYYKTMKRFGVEKRDILVMRVRDARKSQDEAKEVFRTALEKFRTVVAVDGGPLEEKFNTLNRELERSEDRARQVRDRIKDVRDVSDDLFKEWNKEIGQYSDRALQAASERERVPFLKHNLNARAIGALKGELVGVSTSVDSLIAQLDQSIKEANAFISEMDVGEPTKPAS